MIFNVDSYTRFLIFLISKINYQDKIFTVLVWFFITKNTIFDTTAKLIFVFRYSNFKFPDLLTTVKDNH